MEGGRGSRCKRSSEHKPEVKVTFNKVVFQAGNLVDDLPSILRSWVQSQSPCKTGHGGSHL